MDNRGQQFEQALAGLTPQWDAERSAQLYAATLRRGRRRAVRRASVSAIALVMLGAAIGVGVQHRRRSEDAPALAARTQPPRPLVVEPPAAPSGALNDQRPERNHTLRLSDGSTATLLGQSEVASVEETRERITLKLISGRAHFEVVRNPRRQFVVEAAPYRVQVIGTIFDVERRDERVDVRVTRGHVRVFGPEGRTDLLAGQAAQFGLGDQDEPRRQAALDAFTPKATRAPFSGTQPTSGETRARPRALPKSLARAGNAQQPDTAVRADDVATSEGSDAITAAQSSTQDTPRMSGAQASTRDTSRVSGAQAGTQDTSRVSGAQAGAQDTSRVSGAQAGTQDTSRVSGARADSWRSLTRSGQYDAAFESLRRNAPVVEDPAALMDAADAARLSGHPGSAAQFLQRVAREHPESPVAPLAAFTLGRVYLEELGQPELAAAAFKQCRDLDPGGSMAQDALAREVEALSKAGQAEPAYRRAEEYVQRYPHGRRLHAVQLYGGLR